MDSVMRLPPARREAGSRSARAPRSPRRAPSRSSPRRFSPLLQNGVFPSADQIVFDPADPARAVARMTYGLLTTRDGGASWRWICEGAVGYDDAGGQSSPIAAGGEQQSARRAD